jgi:hypothetical protein
VKGFHFKNFYRISFILLKICLGFMLYVVPILNFFGTIYFNLHYFNKEIKIKSPAQIGLEAKQIGKKEGRRERLKILADMSQHSHLGLFFCKPKVRKSRS